MLPALVGRMREAARWARHLAKHGPVYWRESVNLPGSRRGHLGRALDILRGYHPLEADCYRQIHGTCRGFVTNFDREVRLRAVNGADGYAIDNKLILAQILEACSLPTPEVFGVRTTGPWMWRPAGRERVERILADGGRFVVKPIGGKKGAGFRICRTLADLEQPTPNAVMATALVEQADYAHRIFPGSLNTLRILMLRDETGAVFVAAATHRFGCAASAPVDNFSAGGIVANVRLDSGVLDCAVFIEAGNKVISSSRHPETAAAIKGVTVSHWAETLEFVACLGEALPLLRYVGWDTAITASGPLVIEGNSHPSLRSFQFYENIIERPRNCRFFAEYLPYLRSGA